MTRTAVVTGSSSGIGAATKRALEADGFSVFGIDLHGTDLDADLGTPNGRALAIAQAMDFCGGTLDALVPCAGLSGLPDRPGSLLASINYFGTVDLIVGLKAALQASGAASVVAISSNSTTIQPG
ncbi:MAG: NAD-dependent epimerase, partial [Actinomycetota bacterium]